MERIEKELNVEFNSRKQKLLKSMHTFISQVNSLSINNYLTVYGTSTYHVIWEDICKKVFGNKLNIPLNKLNLTGTGSNILQCIEKPKWVLKNGNFHKSIKSFEPDIVTFEDDIFVILDAKYYNLKFDDDKLDGQPGLGDITKQYLYHLALKDFIEINGFNQVKNALLFPKYGGEIENKGYVEIKILFDLNLENIQVVMLPVNLMEKNYLDNKIVNISYFF